MKTITVQTKGEMKATGMPKGAIIDYDDAPKFMQERYDSMNSSKASSECVASNVRARIEALKIREGVAQAHGTHAKCATAADRMVLSMMNAGSVKMLTA